MRKSLYVCAGLAALLATASAEAAPVVSTHNGLGIWYDIRTNGAGSVNGVPQNITTAPGIPFTRGQSLFSNLKAATFAIDVAAGNQGGPGDAEILRLSPRLPTIAGDTLGGAHIIPGAAKGSKRDTSGADLFMYLTVGDRSAPAEVIAALGLTKAVTRTSGSNPIQNLTYTPNATLWSASGTSSTVGPDVPTTGFVVTTKAVKVPVAAGPTFDATGGAIPTAVYQAATIHVTAGEWVKATPPARYTVTDSVNNLLVTRVYNGAGLTPELPDFGYITRTVDATHQITGSDASGNLPEVGTTDGNTLNDTSASADAQIIVQMKFDYDNSGTVTSGDIPFFTAAVNAGLSNTIRQREVYLGDGNSDNLVTSGDIPQLTRYVNASLQNCPCP